MSAQTTITVTRQGASELNYYYRLAGLWLVLPETVADLQFYEAESKPDLVNTEQESQPAVKEQWQQAIASGDVELRYSGTAPFDGQLQVLDCWQQGDILQLDIAKEPVCLVDMSRSEVFFLNDQPISSRLNLEVLTGPVLMLLLAQFNCFSLHAGAVSTAHGVIAFIAESGVGKSTLSADVSEDWAQCADDIAPLKINHSEVELLAYPQLKLPLAQARMATQLPMPLTAIFRLTKEASDEIQFKQLSSSQAMLEVVRHTVAAKLFNFRQLEQHLIFAKNLSSLLPVYEVSYPRKLDALPELREQIVDWLEKQFNA